MLTHDVIEALRDRLSQLPRQLAVAVENLFEEPHRYTSALDLGMEAGVAIVSVYRNVDAAQLGSPKRLLIAAKVLRGFGYLRDPGYSVLDVSIKLGTLTLHSPEVMTVIAVPVIVVLLTYLFQRTYLGLAMRFSSERSGTRRLRAVPTVASACLSPLLSV